VAGAFVNPNGITLNSNSPSAVDLPVPHLHVKDGEIARTFHSTKGIINSWEGVHIFRCDRIQPTIVDAETPFPIFLSDQNDWCSPRAIGRDDNIIPHHGLNLIVDQLALAPRTSIRGLMDGQMVPSINDMFNYVRTTKLMR
jgi:hypothetical protein